MIVKPQTFLIGHTCIHQKGLSEFLHSTDQNEFDKDISQAYGDNLFDGEIICSLMAKLCYKSLVPGKNDNITRTRSIKDNLIATLDSGHGSVFEHYTLNFVTVNCSRIFTHELVRHRVGIAFSQTSGRYVTEDFNVVLDPTYNHPENLNTLEYILSEYNKDKEILNTINNFDLKKKITSALRRLLPNSTANDIGWSANIRTLRHLLMLRTNRHAEWEMRYVFNQVYHIMNKHCPLMLHGHKVEEVDGLLEVTGMKVQPYDTR